MLYLVKSTSDRDTLPIFTDIQSIAKYKHLIETVEAIDIIIVDVILLSRTFRLAINLELNKSTTTKPVFVTSECN